MHHRGPNTRHPHNHAIWMEYGGFRRCIRKRGVISHKRVLEPKMGDLEGTVGETYTSATPHAGPSNYTNTKPIHLYIRSIIILESIFEVFKIQRYILNLWQVFNNYAFVGFISSNMEEIIAKFAQLSPQERSKRLDNFFHSSLILISFTMMNELINLFSCSN